MVQLQTILRRPQVERATGLKRSSIYAYMAAGEFPQPIQLGRKSVGWLEAEIAEWQKARITKRAAEQGKPKRARRRRVQ